MGWSNEDNERLAEMVRAGLPTRRIAQLLGRTVWAVQQQSYRLRLRAGRLSRMERVLAVVQAARRPLHTSEIASTTGISVSNVAMLLRRLAARDQVRLEQTYVWRVRSDGRRQSYQVLLAAPLSVASAGTATLPEEAARDSPQ